MDIILDRDGTLIQDEHYLHDPSQVRFIPHVLPALRTAQDLGFRFFLVTNQSGIGRGMFTLDQYHAVQKIIRETLRSNGIRLHGERFCPHAPDAGCTCRKPGIGMWNSLKNEFNLQAENCLMIGDKAEDMAFGRTAGMRACILVLTGHGPEQIKKTGITPPKPMPPVWKLPPSSNGPHMVGKSLTHILRWLIQGNRP